MNAHETQRKFDIIKTTRVQLEPMALISGEPEIAIHENGFFIEQQDHDWGDGTGTSMEDAARQLSEDYDRMSGSFMTKRYLLDQEKRKPEHITDETEWPLAWWEIGLRWFVAALFVAACVVWIVIAEEN